MTAIELRPYQVDSIEAIREAYRRGHRSALLVLATGLGKTVVFAEAARRVVERGGHVLVIAHRSELLDQAADKLRTLGLSVGIEQGRRKVDPSALPDVVVASVQTLAARRGRFPADAFRLVVIDEAHHAIAQSYRDTLEYFGGARVLGVTATPDRTDRVGLGNVFEAVAYRMEIGDGIRQGYLAPLHLRAVQVEGLDLSAVRVSRGDYHHADLERELTRDGALHRIAKPLAELREGRPTLGFTVGVQQARDLVEVLRGYGVRAAAVDGSMGRVDREAVRRAYVAGDVDLVANAMLWTEGFDAPQTSCVALIRPTRSRSLVTQMIGRGTRLADGKQDCLVVDFVPERAGRIRLASPADALAGEDLPTAVADKVTAAMQETGGDGYELIDAAQQELQIEAEERRRLIREVGVVYACHRLDPDLLLEMAEDEAEDHPSFASGRAASAKQVEIIARSGLRVPDDITARQASGIIAVLARRREAGLCTPKQARKLAAYGLRDDVSFDDAREAMDAIAANNWRPPEWLRADPRFGHFPAKGAA